MKKAIKHFTKLLTCEQFIVTGSYALQQLGLWSGAKDLDILLVNPTSESVEILKRLQEKPINPDYPGSDEQYRVPYEDIYVDFFIKKTKQPALLVFEAGPAPKMMMWIAYPTEIAKAKKKYPGEKQLLQRKIIAELFYNPKELEAHLESKQQRLTPKFSTLSVVEKTIDQKVDEILDEDEYLEDEHEPWRKSKPSKK